MATDYTWLLNGIDLDAASGHLVTATLWRPPVSVRRPRITIPGRHGTAGSGALPVFDEPTMTISVRVEGTQHQLEAAVNLLAGQFAQPALILTRSSGGITASAEAELVSADLDQDFTPGRLVTPTAVLAIPGVFFVESDQVHGLPLAGQHAIDGLAGSSAPCSGVLRLAGPASAVSIVDHNSGTGVSWSGELSAGGFLFVRPRDLRAWLSADAEQWTPGGTDVSGGVDYPARGPLQLWPKVDGSVLASIVTEGTSEASALVLRAGRHFL